MLVYYVLVASRDKTSLATSCEPELPRHSRERKWIGCCDIPFIRSFYQPASLEMVLSALCFLSNSFDESIVSIKIADIRSYVCARLLDLQYHCRFITCTRVFPDNDYPHLLFCLPVFICYQIGFLLDM